MSPPRPHFLLFSEARTLRQPGAWRFVLSLADGSSRIEVADREPAVHGERLELLAAVRGMEALEQPSRVTLISPCEYVRRGIQYGLDEWRENDWQWESFGRLERIKHWDLWRRLDWALTFHDLEIQWRRIDRAHTPSWDESRRERTSEPRGTGGAPRRGERWRRTLRWVGARLGRTVRERSQSARLACAPFGAGVLQPAPWIG